MSYIKLEPYVDGVIKTVTMNDRMTPPVPVWEDTPWGKARVVKEFHVSNPEENMRKSISRTKSHITAYAHNMEPEWFGTLTLSPEKVKDRYDMNLCRNIVSKWLENIRSRKCKDMMFLVVPERHEDGAWHFHIILSHVNELSFKESGKKYKGEPIYNLQDWRYGFTNFTRVRDAQKTATYMSKYITKSLISDIPNRQRYLVSKNIPIYEPITVETSLNSAEDLITEEYGKNVETTYERYFDMSEKFNSRKPIKIRLAFHQEKEVINDFSRELE